MRVLEITAPASVLADRLRTRARETEAGIATRLARAVTLPEDVERVVIPSRRTRELETNAA